ncbi:hypothetical protein PC116_g22031 [Phytophthora cactorum]|uniref:Uncharacterized protein n=1 Tax=Phytophthora cactorum TaxID=29920 RepID=A0A8T1K1Z7_9STRA|nr:hypothetical protein PC111_g15920 [Phytophthora cactorum]KAG2810672.1 hypothetical protein PC112_g15950 [Phytophthora cactorum]KAG2846442.1 hypothetical protein PC113_g17975 [Phytophthora cactorum]KAG2978000.1 hypothetical protein PC118_g12529 [Phytophthora cactorum]KAG3140531.1 hypothetical protein C6341_g20015 [Phytophthora cactorum]
MGEDHRTYVERHGIRRAGAGLVSDPLLCRDEDERGVSRIPLSGTDLISGLLLV